eukprot:2419843-Pleurochrysis_carterae.AAC.3
MGEHLVGRLDHMNAASTKYATKYGDLSRALAKEAWRSPLVSGQHAAMLSISSFLRDEVLLDQNIRSGR